MGVSCVVPNFRASIQTLQLDFRVRLSIDSCQFGIPHQTILRDASWLSDASLESLVSLNSCQFGSQFGIPQSNVNNRGKKYH